MFSWTFAVAPLAAAPRLLKGRSVGKALPHFLYLLRTANARQRRAHQSDASARIFCVLRRVFWSPQGHLVGDAASGRACILCAPARSKERGASPQNLRTSAPFVARHCLSPRSTFYRSLKNTVIIGYVELLKSITCGKPRRAREAAAAARFFDDSVRNSYARRATTPQTASWRQGEFRAEARKRSRRCGNGVAQPSQIKTRAFLFGGRAALAVRNTDHPSS